MKTNIIYVYDALCGWCYGFSPVMTAFAEKYADQVQIEVVSGGMITGERIGPIGEVAGYISQAYKDVEQRTGVTFGQGFLQDILADGKAIFTSIPPAKALSIIKRDCPEISLPFSARLQKAIYYDGIRPKDHEAYGALAAEYGLDAAEFTRKMDEPETLQLAQTDFGRAAQFGVTGFPTVIVERGGQYYAIARGYTPLALLERNYTLLLERQGNR